MHRIVIALVLAVGVGHADPAKPWLYLPGKPTAETIRFAKKQTSAHYVIKQAPDLFVVAFMQLGHSKDFDADAVLDKAVEIAVSTAAATIVAGPSKPSFDNAKAREVIVKLPNASTVTMRFVVADEWMYVFYLGDPKALDPNGALRTPPNDDTTIYGGLVGGEPRGHGPAPNSRRPSPTPQSKIIIGQPTTSGGELDRAIIRRYIKRNLPKLQYCYEQQLAKNKKLAGTVKAEFVIAASGTVSSAKASGVDAKVSDCVADVIHDIEFPKPRDGKDVSVTYPLTFHPPDKK